MWLPAITVASLVVGPAVAEIDRGSSPFLKQSGLLKPLEAEPPRMLPVELTNETAPNPGPTFKACSLTQESVDLREVLDHALLRRS